MSPRGRLGVLHDLKSRPPPPVSGERCDMCAAPIAGDHSHVVDIASRTLMCTCRGCYLLFTARGADLRFRAVPERFLSFDDFALGPAQWDALEIPVGLAFFFQNSTIGRTLAFYPGPAGVTESELPLEAWESVVAANPRLRLADPDVEALLIRATGSAHGASDQVGAVSSPDCYLVPIDACYELAGRLRSSWRGFDGGQDARAQIAEFFDTLRARARPAPPSPESAEAEGAVHAR